MTIKLTGVNSRGNFKESFTATLYLLGKVFLRRGTTRSILSQPKTKLVLRKIFLNILRVCLSEGTEAFGKARKPALVEVVE